MKQLDGQCIAVTGAAGGIGSLLCQRLVARGAHVVGIDRLPSPEANSEIIADIGSFEGISSRPSHGAADAGGPPAAWTPTDARRRAR